MVVLTWLHQLQQCFYEYNDVNPGKDWNKHGRYCGVSTKVAQNAPTLSNINSLTAIDGHDRQYFNELRSTVVSRRIFIRLQSLIAR